MSRCNYSDELDNWDMIMWRGAVTSALRGKRGQEALKELLRALDAMPVKQLISHELVDHGAYCTLGVLGAARGLPLDGLDPEDYDAVAEAFGLAPAMVREIEFYNDDDGGWDESPTKRWTRMRRWVAEQIVEAKP